jgi:hypothetical protein
VALARLGGTAATGEVAAAAGYRSSTEASPVREELIGKGIIYAPRRGRLAFTVPKFEQFTLEHLERYG